MSAPEKDAEGEVERGKHTGREQRGQREKNARLGFRSLSKNVLKRVTEGRYHRSACRYDALDWLL